MSLITFSEAHCLERDIEVEGIVKSMETGCEVWIDYLQDYRRVCNAKLADGEIFYIVQIFFFDVAYIVFHYPAFVLIILGIYFLTKKENNKIMNNEN